MLLFVFVQTRAQMTTTVLWDSPDSQINVYIVSQGFTSTSMPTFNNFVKGFVGDIADNTNGYLWSVSPYLENKSRFKIIRVNLPGSVENQPGAYFQFENVAPTDLHYYISVQPGDPQYNQYQTNECYADFRTRMNNLRTTLPGWNTKSYIISVFNNNYYTGGGGEYTFATIFGTPPAYNSATMYKIITHEFSHTFGLLADEYIRSPSTPYQKDPLTCAVLVDNNDNPLVIDPTTFPLFQDRNVTLKTALVDIPWNYLITISPIPQCSFNLSCPGIGIGLYNGSNYSAAIGLQSYRSDNTCCMRNVSFPFCQVCKDLLGERVQEHLCYPTNNVTDNFISRHQYITHWRKASTSLTSNSVVGNTISVNFVSGSSITLTTGFNASSGSDFWAYIGDCATIPLVNQYKVTSVTNPTTSAPRMSAENIDRDDIKIIPNPSSSFVTIDAANHLIKSVSLYSIDGKILFNQKINNQETYSLDISEISKGTYIITIDTDKGETISRKLIKN